MLLIDVLIRCSAIALMLMFAVLAIRDAWRVPAARYAALVSISLSAMLLGTAPEQLQLPWSLYAITRILDIFSISLIWWLGLSMFQDDFKLGKFEWTGFLLYAVPIFIFYRLPDLGIDLPFSPSFDRVTSIGVDIITFALMAHLIYVALKGRNDDLVESRRKFRLYFVLTLVVGALATVIAENFMAQSYGPELSILRGAVVLPIVIWGLLALTRLHSEKFLFQPTEPTALKSVSLDPRDKALHARLVDLMETDKAYTEMGLTIRHLAERLNTPEHRLRLMINKGLGHRNFSAFLNTFRIKAAKAALSDPENARLPVLTIAMDVGFASLSPFNRAFKAAIGQTPTEYRQNALSKAGQN